MRERLIELLRSNNAAPEKTCPRFGTGESCEGCKYLTDDIGCDYIAREADYLFANGIIVPPCKVGDTVYKIIKFCEENTGYNEFYRPSKEFKEDCPYLDPQEWGDDCDRCKAVENYDESCYCTLNLKILCDTCKSRLAIQKDKFKWSMMNSVFNTPMFDANTDLENTYFLTREEAEAALKGGGEEWQA